MTPQKHPKDMNEDELADALDEARTAKDRERYDLVMKYIPVPPESLMAIKKLRGAEYVRQNFNTIRGDKKYGPGWLDK